MESEVLFLLEIELALSYLQRRLRQKKAVVKYLCKGASKFTTRGGTSHVTTRSGRDLSSPDVAPTN